jgi:hypothetical protein
MTFIRYAKNQIILKFAGARKPRGRNRIAKIG